MSTFRPTPAGPPLSSQPTVGPTSGGRIGKKVKVEGSRVSVKVLPYEETSAKAARRHPEWERTLNPQGGFQAWIVNQMASASVRARPSCRKPALGEIAVVGSHHALVKVGNVHDVSRDVVE